MTQEGERMGARARSGNSEVQEVCSIGRYSPYSPSGAASEIFYALVGTQESGLSLVWPSQCNGLREGVV